jgi:hypothetical protein
VKKRLSKGESDFIKGCTKAILKKEISHHHWLYVVGGVKQYVCHKDDTYPENHPVFKHAMCVCAIGKEFIIDWNRKAGNDDFSKPWVKRSLEHLIMNSQSMAKVVYTAQRRPVTYKELVDLINTEGLSEKGKQGYLKKVRSLILNY